MQNGPQTTLAEKRKKTKALTETKQYTATTKYLREKHRIFSLILPGGLAQFNNEGRLTELGIMTHLKLGTVAPDAVLAAVRHEPTPMLTAQACDQESTQLCGDSICEDVLRCTMSSHYDPHHRIFNDAKNEIKRCSMWSFYTASILIFNIGYGPWKSCAFFRAMVTSTTIDAKFLMPDGPMCLAFWSRILADKGLTHESDPHLVGKPAREAMLERISSMPQHLMHGEKVSGKSFFSLNTAYRFWKTRYHELALSVVLLCLTKGWVRLCVIIERDNKYRVAAYYDTLRCNAHYMGWPAAMPCVCVCVFACTPCLVTLHAAG